MYNTEVCTGQSSAVAGNWGQLGGCLPGHTHLAVACDVVENHLYRADTFCMLLIERRKCLACLNNSLSVSMCLLMYHSVRGSPK